MLCKYCGAPLKGGKCEYCGSNNGLSVNLLNMQGTLTFDGEEIKVYVAEIYVDNGLDQYTDMMGRIHRVGKPKRKFTLMEV